MKLCYTLSGLLLLGMLTCCDPTVLLGPQAVNADKYNLRVDYHRGSCYGRCEVYGLKVYDNGLLVFTGERFTDRPGTWEKNIDRRRVVALLDSFERAEFNEYPPSFRGEIPDAPVIKIAYTDAAGQTTETAFQDEAPTELRRLDRALHRLAHLPDYRLVSDTIIGNLLRPSAKKQREELIVELREGVSADSWVVAYGKQNVAIKQRISPSSNYYIILADPNLMAAEELLTFLRQDVNVLSAQLNAEVRPR